MNIYRIAGFPVTDELYHYGIPGQSWGNRRFQNSDGSLTPLGRQHYNVGPPLKGGRGVVSETGGAGRTAITQPARTQAGIATRGSATSNRATTRAPAKGFDVIPQASQNYPMTNRGRQLTAAVDGMDQITAWLSETDDVLKSGAKSTDDVKRLQNALMNLGYDLKKFGVDGKFGTETRAALNAFKRDMGLKEDGVLDLETSRKLQGSLEDHLSRETKKVQPNQNGSAATAPRATAQSRVASTQADERNQSQNRQENVATQPESKTVTPKTKEEIKSTENYGQKRSDEILKSLEESGNRISEQHKKASESVSKAASNAGKALSKAAKDVGKTASNAVNSVSEASKKVAASVSRMTKTGSDAAKSITEAANSVKVSAIKVSKAADDAVKVITKQSNKLVSEITNLTDSLSKSFDKKKRKGGLSSFLSGAKNTVENGLKTVSSLFG